MKLYKYLRLFNCNHDIICYTEDDICMQHIYCATYKELNDPLESYFRYAASQERSLDIESLLETKGNTRIACFSRTGNSNLMWTHYSDNHRGICLEIDEVCGNAQKEKVIYRNALPDITDIPMEERARYILMHKMYEWRYEKEVRYLTQNEFLDIHISRILCGCRMSEDDIRQLKSLIHNDIEIHQVKPTIIKTRLVFE